MNEKEKRDPGVRDHCELSPVERKSEEAVLKEEIDEILVTSQQSGSGIAHIPGRNGQTLCADRTRHNELITKDPEAWRLWSWDNRRLCKRCKEICLKEKEFLEEYS